MNSPMVSSSSFEELQELYRKLSEASAKSDHLFDEAVDRGDIESLQFLTCGLRGIAEQFKVEVKQHFVELSDKRVLLKTEYEGLKEFAKGNGKAIEDILKKVTIKDHSVVRANFYGYGVTVLAGLESLTWLQELEASANDRLGSLKGVPTANLKKLSAHNCGLTSLRAIKDANNLEVLNLNFNCALRLLDDVPTTNLETLYASSCGLESLKAIEDAKNLICLDLGTNPALASLDGIPTGNLQILNASDCGLRSIEVLLEAGQLQRVDLRGNSNIPREQLRKLVDQIAQIGGGLLSGGANS